MRRDHTFDRMTNWISVRDRLPDNAQPVLIAEYDPGYSSRAISGEYFTDAGFVYVDAREGMRRGKDVRYWMPSPVIPPMSRNFSTLDYLSFFVMLGLLLLLAS